MQNAGAPMDIKRKRKMLEVLRGLIGSGFEGNQSDICNHLNRKGFDVTQSTVSRALKKIGASKVTGDKKVRYEIRPQETKPNYHGSLLELMISMEANESQIVIKTNPGSAMFLAGFLDHYCKANIIGTVAGDDTIFVAPRSTRNIKKHQKAIRDFITDFLIHFKIKIDSLATRVKISLF
jgi:transcriptional regulator of arginine metabolism